MSTGRTSSAPPLGPAAHRLSVLLDRVRADVVAGGHAEPLEPARYARTHAVYEAASNQRRLIIDWLVRTLAQPGPVRRVLSVGTGDGAVDLPVAADLLTRGPLTWVGVEPDPAVGARFAAAMAALGDGVDASVLAARFEQVARDLPGGFDRVLFVHSLYYVGDLVQTVALARSQLVPTGRLVALIAPREQLCQLTEAVLGVGPQGGLHYAEDLLAALDLTSGRPATAVTRLDAELDVTDCFEPASQRGQAILDFTIGSPFDALPDRAQQAVLDYLRVTSTVHGGRRWLAHPVLGVQVGTG